MPKQTISQNIGREGEKWFEAQLPSSWIAQRPTEDIGIDRQIVICEDGTLNGLEFRVQIKSHMHLRRRESSIVERFERQKLVQLVTGFVPTLGTSDLRVRLR